MQSVVFEPSKYSWAMTEELFEEIVTVAPLQEFCQRHNDKLWETGGWDRNGKKFLHDSDVEVLGVRGFVERYMGGEMPFGEEEIKEGFVRYMARANETRELFGSGRLERAWTGALRQLPEVGMFTLGSWDFDKTIALQHRVETKGRGWEEIRCEVYEHKHNWDAGHNHARCRRPQEPVGGAVFNTAIASLIAAGSTITGLDIKYCAEETFSWADNGLLQDLDLSHLESLFFRPQTWEDGEGEKMGDRNFDLGREERLEARAALAVTSILKKSSQSIKTLEIVTGVPRCPFAWPLPDSIIALPSLERFYTGASLHLPAFARFVKLARNLKHLELKSCHGKGWEWRQLWDAIRHHPSRMMLVFDQLPCSDAAEISMNHWTGEESKDEGYEDDVWMNIDRSLENYVSNRGKWDRSCRMWFDGAASDEETESEDESGSDEESAGGEDGSEGPDGPDDEDMDGEDRRDEE